MLRTCAFAASTSAFHSASGRDETPFSTRLRSQRSSNAHAARFSSSVKPSINGVPDNLFAKMSHIAIRCPRDNDRLTLLVRFSLVILCAWASKPNVAAQPASVFGRSAATDYWAPTASMSGTKAQCRTYPRTTKYKHCCCQSLTPGNRGAWKRMCL